MFPEFGKTFIGFIEIILHERIPKSGHTLFEIVKILYETNEVKWSIEGSDQTASDQFENLKKILQSKNGKSINDLTTWINSFDNYLRNLRLSLQE